MAKPRIVFYSSQELELTAEVFLNKFHKPPGSLPVEIDVIAEADLGMSIRAFSLLEKKYGLHAYLALSLKTIYMEPYIIDDDVCEPRYRFTIAEEIAHSILHKDLFIDVKSPEEYMHALDQISEVEHNRMEMDAKRLSEAILMPAETFRQKCLDLSANSVKIKDKLNSRAYLFRELASIFNVSIVSVSYRFRHLGLEEQIEFGA